MTAQPDSQSSEGISLSELLAVQATNKLTIRFICAARKVLHDAEGQLTADEMDLAYDINRLYMSFGKHTRAEAYRDAQERLSSVNTAPPLRAVPVVLPSPEIERPKVRYAPVFTTERCRTLLEQVLENIKSSDNVSATFSQIKIAVRLMHTDGGNTTIREAETKVCSNGLQSWEMRLQGELQKLRKLDVISYRATKGDYFIF
jgi:hypothetical protein